jgi:hypothetical protein
VVVVVAVVVMESAWAWDLESVLVMESVSESVLELDSALALASGLEWARVWELELGLESGEQRETRPPVPKTNRLS